MNLNLVILLFTILLGLLFGSFFNVVGIRIPNGESVVAPPSHCPNCKRRLAPWELVPVLSWLILRGRCRICRVAVSWVYPVMELATGLIFGLVFLHSGFSMELVVGLIAVSTFVILSVSDIYYHRIPNVILFPAIVVVFVLRLFIHPLGLWTYYLGAVIGFLVMFIIAIVSRGGMGYGDVKLFFFVGLFTGLPGVLLSLFFSSLIGTVIGLSMRLAGKLQAREPFPFGPAISLAAILVYLYGHSMLNLYFIR